LVILYAVYSAALVMLGLGLGTGVLPGGGSPLLTLLPAALGAAAIALALGTARAPGQIERRLASLQARPLQWLATIASDGGEGVRYAIALVARRPATLLGAAPEPAVLMLCYFVGMLGNLLPLPGGVGGVEGGMVGAFVAFGQPAGVALVAVLPYRLVAF
jgi:hypothetical protein